MTNRISGSGDNHSRKHLTNGKPARSPAPSASAYEPPDALKIAQTRLFAHYDELNAKWEQIETLLTAFHVPHAVWVTFKNETALAPGEPQHEHSHRVGIAKLNGKWRVAYYWEDELRPDEMHALAPMVEAPAWVRVEAAGAIEKLALAMAEKSLAFCDRARKAIEKLEDVFHQFA